MFQLSQTLTKDEIITTNARSWWERIAEHTWELEERCWREEREGRRELLDLVEEYLCFFSGVDGEPLFLRDIFSSLQDVLRFFGGCGLGLIVALFSTKLKKINEELQHI